MAVLAFLLLGVSFFLHTFHLYDGALTNRWSQPLAGVRCKIFVTPTSQPATRALARGG